MGNQGVKEWKSFPAWLRYGVILVLVLGIFFRFYNLDKKVYWIDETNSSLRSLGYTKTELIENVFTGQVVKAETLQHYQQLSADRSWGDTMHALMGTAEHTPLYFMLSRLWVGVVGHSVFTMRLLTAIFSVLALPCLFWLCRELFASPAVAWIAVALVAISPLHVLYAQEARPYSLLSVFTLLSSAVLLWAMRIQRRSSWLLYGLTITAGLYTHLLFGLVPIAHGVYVGLMEEVWQKRRLSRTVISYLLATGVALLALTPWLVLLYLNFAKVSASTASIGEDNDLSYIINIWFLNASRIFIDRELGSLNGLFILLAFYALFFLRRHADRRTWLFVITLVAVTFLALAIPDLVWGGRRSIRIRYLFPPILGIEIALAYLFASTAVQVSTWGQKAWRLLMVLLVTGGVMAAVASASATIWWTKSVPRSSYYIPVSRIINQSSQPLVLSDGPVTDTLSFSLWLNPDVNLQLVIDFKQLKVAPGFKNIFLLNGSKQLRNRLTKRNYHLTPLYENPDARGDSESDVYPLWAVKGKG